MLLSNLLTRKVIPTAGNKILYSWGNSTYGQGGVIEWPHIVPATSWSMISNNGTHTLGLDSLGRLYSWGQNNHGQLGIGTTQDKKTPVQIGSSSWIAISAGREFSMAIRKGGTLFTWGNDGYGRLGFESGLTQVPVKLKHFVVSNYKRQSGVSVQPYVDDEVVQVDYSWNMVSSGRHHSIAIRSDKRLFAWGYNGSGQLGDNTTNERSSPVQVHSFVKFNHVASSMDTSYAISEEGDLYTWGSDYYGQAGGSCPYTFEPIKVKIKNDESTAAIAGLNTINNNLRYYEYAPNNYFTWTYADGGYHHSAAIRSDGKMFLAGEGSYNQLGRDFTANTSWDRWYWDSNREFPVQLGQVTNQNQIPVYYDQNSWTTVSSGRHHSAGIRSDGKLFMWGYNYYGQLGDNTEFHSVGRFPFQLGDSSWTAVSAGHMHTIAIRSDGKLFTWGNNNYGQCGDGTTVNKRSPTQIGNSSWTSIAASKNGDFNFAILSNGHLYGWGRNDLYQLGDGTNIDKSSPVLISSAYWSQVKAGISHGVAIKSGGTLFAWGHNNHGQLGDNTTIDRSTPVQIGSSSWTALAAGHHFTLGIRSGGTLFAWGYNGHGELGDGSLYIPKSSPVQIGSSSWAAVGAGTFNSFAIRNDGVMFTAGIGDRGENFRLRDIIPRKIGPKEDGSWVQVQAGMEHAIGLKADGRLYTWGYNNHGQLGFNDTINRSSPTQLGSSSWSFVGAGDSHTVAIRSDGRLFAWGVGGHGQLGDNTTITRYSPVQIGSSSWIAASGGLRHTIAIRSGGTLFAWGENGQGQLGDDNAVIKPGLIGEGMSWVAISTKGGHTLAIRSDGILWGWGSNGHGQLGDNTTISRTSSPVQIGSSSWTAVAAGYNHSLGIRSDGMLFGWGHNGHGGIGDSTTIDRSTPVQIGYDSWTAIAAGNAYSMAVRLGGTLFTWGYNNQYQLGNGTTIQKSSPVQIGSSSWSVVSCGESHSAAISTSGTMYIWGNQSYGEGGTNPPSMLRPVKFLDSTGLDYDKRSWTAMSSGAEMCAAIDSLGRLFTWGYNSDGQLGFNDTINRSSPTQLGSSSWTAVSVGAHYTLAIRSDGSLFAWGRNNIGQLGDGTNINRSSPVQIGGSLWTAVQNVSIDNYDQPRNYAIRSGGTLFGWGYNNGHYLLGDGTTITRSSPVQIGSSSRSWKTIAGGSDFCLGISNSKLYGWSHTESEGSRNYAGDGFNNFNPISIEDAANSQYLEKSWTAISFWKTIISAGMDGTNISQRRGYAIDSTGKLWAWGQNNYGFLGDGTTIDRSSPVQIGAQNWNSVSAGGLHTLAIRSDGYLFAWGSNGHGQLGDGTTIDKSSPVQIGSSLWTSIDASIRRSFAIRSGGSLFAWGQNRYTAWQYIDYPGILGDGDTIDRSSPVQIGSSSWTAVKSGDQFTVAIRAGGTLFAWGHNSSGQLGDGTTIDKSSPVQIGSSSWTAISAGSHHTMAIRSGGTLFTWGHNGHGQLGDETTIDKSSPVQIGYDSWTVIAAGPATSYGNKIISAGQTRIYAWGYGDYPVLGLSSGWSAPGSISSSPREVISSWIKGLNMSGTTVMAAGPNVFGLIYNGNVGDTGQLLTIGHEPYGYVTGRGLWERFPKRISAFNDVNIITAGLHNANMIRSNGVMYSWGYNRHGQAGVNRPPQDYQEWSPVAQTGSWAAVSSARHTTYALDTSGELWVWGRNSMSCYWGCQWAGGLSLGSDSLSYYGEDVSSPTPINNSVYQKAYGTTYYSKLSNSEPNSGQLRMAINNQGELLTVTGTEYYGELGRISNPVIAPMKMGNASWTAVAAGKHHTVGVSNNKLFAWGYNAYGQIGEGSTYHRSYPNQLGNSSWTAVGAGGHHSHAIRSDGKLFGWGRNDYSQVGDYTTINKSSPVMIAGSSWTVVSGGSYNTVGIYAQKAVNWGYNSNGELGKVTNRSSPIQIGNKSWVAVQARKNRSAGISIENRLYTWGENTWGNNGYGSKDNLDSPVAVGGRDFLWKDKLGSLGGSHTAACSKTGTLYVWGSGGTHSGLGFPAWGAWTPAQIGSESWIAVSAGWTHAVAIRADGKLFAWGRQDDGYPRIGDGTTLNKSSPVQIGEDSWSKISANANRTNAIRSDGMLFGWGYNGHGELGDNTTINRSSPVQVGSSSWNAVSAGVHHTLLLARYNASQSTLYAMGNNGYGQLGDGTTIHKSSPVLVDSTGFWKSVSGGYHHTIGLKENNTLYGWGLSTSGEIGDGTTINKSSPVQIGSSSYNMISAGHHSNYARDSSIAFDKGILWAWGHNPYSIQGDGGYSNISSPVILGQGGAKTSTQAIPSIVGKVNEPGNKVKYWKQISSGQDHTLAIRSDNLLFAFGRNSLHLLGDGTTVDRQSPVQIGSSSWIAVAAGQYHSVAIRSDGMLFAWGEGKQRNNYQGATGEGENNKEPWTIKGSFPFETSWRSISVGQNFMLGIRSDGILYSWGHNGQGQLGNGTTIDSSSPVQIGSSSWIVAEAGDNFSLGIRSGGTLFAWGHNNHGQLGDSTTIAKSSPVQIGSSSWVAVKGSANFSIGIRAGGTLFTWGYNGHGQLGDNTTINKSSPVQIGSSSWTAVDAAIAGNFSLALRSGGTLFAWGHNSSGQLGDSTTIDKSSPVQIGSESWIIISAGHAGTAAIRNDYKLFTWGTNSHGQLGDSTTIAKSSPVQIGNSSWISVGAGHHHTLGVTSGGSLFSWGYNADSRLGDNTTISRSSPVQVGSFSWISVNAGGDASAGITSDNKINTWGNTGHGKLGRMPGNSVPTQISYRSFASIAAGRHHNLAIDTQGKLWAWGYGGSGNIGDGEYSNRSSLVQIGSSSWTILFKGGSTSYASFAIRSGGTLFAWGDNGSYTLGDNTTIAKPSPVQMGTSSWIAVGSGVSNVMAITSAGKLYSWGYSSSSHGQYGEDFRHLLPVKTLTASPGVFGATVIHHKFVSLAQGDYVNAGITEEGRLFTWGHQAYGALGLGDAEDRSSPVQVGSSSWTAVATGRHHGAAIRSDGKLFTWGYNGHGELGDTTTIEKNSPVQIGNSSWIAVHASRHSTSAIRVDGALFTWGQNSHGILGDNTTISKSSPVQIGGSSWTSVSMGAHHMLGLITSVVSNSLYAWGHNSNGSIGDASTTDRSSPVLVSTRPGISWSLISAGSNYSLATDQNGRLWGWGHSGHGCLGPTVTPGNNRRTPERLFVSGTSLYDTSWISIGAGLHTPYVIRSGDRALFTWGYNNYGTMGDGSTLSKSIPVQIGTSAWKAVGKGVGHYSLGAIKYGVDQFAGGQLCMAGQINTSYIGRPPGNMVPTEQWTMNEMHSNWAAVGFGLHHAAALTADNRLYVWGHNNHGQIGDGTNSSGYEQSNPNFAYSYVRGTMTGGQDYLPQYVPNFWPGSLPGIPGRWSDFSLGYRHTLALTVDI